MNNITLVYLAECVIFGIINNRNELEKKIQGQWEYRKGKEFQDVNSAIAKGFKLGSGKTGREIECVAMYLGHVFKKVRSN